MSSIQIGKIIQEAAAAKSVTGLGDHDYIVTHSLRGTSTQRLNDAGSPYTSTAKRTGHVCLKSLKHYHNLRGSVGIQQQATLLPNTKRGAEMSVNSPESKNKKQSRNRRGQEKSVFDLAKKAI